MADDVCPVCRTKFTAPGTVEDPAWLEDPIRTTWGLAGKDYVGTSPAYLGQLRQLQWYYNQLMLDSGLTPPTWINLKYATGSYIVQLRVCMELVLASFGKTLEDYFGGDKYGNVYGRAQIEWTDCERKEGIPTLPINTPLKAIHIEELRRGTYTIFKIHQSGVKVTSNATWDAPTSGERMYYIEVEGGFTFSGVPNTIPYAPTISCEVGTDHQPAVEVEMLSSDASAFKVRMKLPTYQATTAFAEARFSFLRPDGLSAVTFTLYNQMYFLQVLPSAPAYNPEHDQVAYSKSYDAWIQVSGGRLAPIIGTKPEGFYEYITTSISCPKYNLSLSGDCETLGDKQVRTNRWDVKWTYTWPDPDEYYYGSYKAGDDGYINTGTITPYWRLATERHCISYSEGSGQELSEYEPEILDYKNVTFTTSLQSKTGETFNIEWKNDASLVF